MINNNKQYLNILKTFLNISVPSYIKFNNNNIDLMMYYEELFNYVGGILEGKKVDLDLNSYGTGKSIVFNEEYRNILLEISKDNDLDLKIFCYLNLTVLYILEEMRQL